eukprot:snap_masked-scaffold_62-processed-gene-0.39-mRNA-1 protein AED:1.00 eAED:1.00 QI:0/0/0/0/1/1/2/0/131
MSETEDDKEVVATKPSIELDSAEALAETNEPYNPFGSEKENRKSFASAASSPYNPFQTLKTSFAQRRASLPSVKESIYSISKIFNPFEEDDELLKEADMNLVDLEAMDESVPEKMFGLVVLLLIKKRETIG